MPVIKSAALRMALRLLIPFVLFPALALAASSGGRFALITLAAAALALLLFIAGFERKSVGTRRLVLCAVIIALSVAGRFIPLFKPVTALTVIAAVYMGSEAGFLVGAASAVISDFYFGLGPWTPFQMLAWGMIGLIAGFASGALKKSRVLLVAYGLLSGVIFSMVMDVWTVVWYSGGFDAKLYMAAILSAVPYTCLYAVSNAGFLLLLGKPLGEKLERIRIKYGI